MQLGGFDSFLSPKVQANVQLTIASGLGGMLLTAGQPFGHDVL